MIIHSAGARAHALARPIVSARTPGATDTAAYSPRPETIPAQSETETQNASPTKESETERLLKALRDYIDKGPIVALREKILKSMNLTEEKLKAMTPDQQNAVEAEIARKVKEYLLEQQEAAKNPTSPQQAQARLLAYQAMHATPK